MDDTPRIHDVQALGSSRSIEVTWADGCSDRINLSGWIATGDEVLLPLRQDAVFSAARIGEYGRAVIWGDQDGDLAIDAVHLRLLADEQRPFSADDLKTWQADMKLSNQEAKDFLGVSLSTFNLYKAGGAKIPNAVGMACRAARRDPLLMQAHFRPRRPGRPRAA